ncbi:MAG TPA: hypothetical protein VGC79_03605 [Polyangiaceae bacterium]
MFFRTPRSAQRLRERAGLTKNMRFARWQQRLLSGALLLSACSAAPTPEDSAGASSAALCQPPEGVSGSPRTIEEAVTLLNALPKPTSVACFLESLDRPLQAIATRNIVSAQPAFSAASPRIFLRLEQLVLSVVPEGGGSRLIEFSYLLEGDARSIKAELAAPLTEAVSASAPYQHTLPTDPEGLARGGTVCGGCHGGEERVKEIDFAPAFSSVAFRPNPSYQVSLEALAEAERSCDRAAQPERCAILTALFGHGPITQAEFPNTMVIFN